MTDKDKPKIDYKNHEITSWEDLEAKTNGFNCYH